MQVDFLIIGQGLAGSLLAWELMQRDCKVMVIDSGHQNASLVASGIINPITGKRFVKSVNIDTLLPIAESGYLAIENFFGQQFYFPKPMFRIFRNDSELNQCLRKFRNNDYSHYLAEIKASSHIFHTVNAPFGYVVQQRTGHLQTQKLLACLKQFFIENEAYRRATFDYESLSLSTASVVVWKEIVAHTIIFCEGFYCKNNPWFAGLPLQPAKGEMLTLATTVNIGNEIINYGNWLLPSQTGSYRLGATFDTQHHDKELTESGKKSLLDTLKIFSPILAQSSIIAHEADVRPCTLDKQPFLGRHPEHFNICIFNGFGAKGCVQIPWYSQHFADHLLNLKPLLKTCDIQRYRQTHFSGKFCS